MASVKDFSALSIASARSFLQSYYICWYSCHIFERGKILLRMERFFGLKICILNIYPLLYCEKYWVLSRTVGLSGRLLVYISIFRHILVIMIYFCYLAYRSNSLWILERLELFSFRYDFDIRRRTDDSLKSEKIGLQLPASLHPIPHTQRSHELTLPLVRSQASNVCIYDLQRKTIINMRIL